MSSESEEEFTGGDDDEEEEAADDDDEEEEADDDDEYNEDGDSDVPLSSLKASRKREAKKITPSEDGSDDDDDDDDDVPLSSLAPKKSSAIKAKNGSKEKATPKKPTKTKAKATPKKKAKADASKAKKKKESTGSSAATGGGSSSSSDKYEWASAALYGSECEKGLLVQRLLCRWWYAITWPDPAKIPAKPPKHHDSLDGFPGVYVCTSGDKVGKLLDLRDNENAPSFRNFAKKPAKELKELLIKALEEQKKQLLKAEGGDDPSTEATKKEIENLIKWANKVNPDKADKETVKILKAAKLELPS